jgi:NCAIR mutase (PurE)-related protein
VTIASPQGAGGVVELRLDHRRQDRTGLAEAVYAPGKTPGQCAAAVRGLLAGGAGPVLLTRADPRQARRTLAANPGGTLTQIAELAILSWRPAAARGGAVPVLTAGTADLPVAAEAVAVLAAYGYRAPLVADVGVAGIHRVLAQASRLATADVVLVVAGMEGALASVVAGLTSAPVIAVPTSTGYGAGLDGITALLAMHASCAPGVTVVGIDNGFGAACAAVRVLGRLATAAGAHD